MPSNFIKDEGSWLYLLLAFLVASFLWYTVNAREQIERTIEVRLDYKNLPQGLIVRNGQIKGLEVRLRGPRELLRSIGGRELSYTVDLRDIKKGVNVVPFDWDRLADLRPYQVQEVIPPRLSLEVDEFVEKRIPVSVRFRDNALSQAVRVEWIGIKPDAVTVRGASADIAQLDAMVAEAPLQMNQEDTPQTVDAAIIGPPGVEVLPAVIKAEYRVSFVRKTIKLQREVSLEGTSRDCQSTPETISLRVAVPEHMTKNAEYLDRIRTVVDASGVPEELLELLAEDVMVNAQTEGTSPAHEAGAGPASSVSGVELPVVVHLPEGARLESQTPEKALVTCK